MLAEVTLSLKGGFTARGSSGDGLPVEWICHVSSSEYPRDLGAWCSSFGEDIAYFIGVDVGGE